MARFCKEDAGNYVSPDRAITPSDAGQCLYDAPIIAIGSVDDPWWQRLKEPQAIGPHFKGPTEWLPNARTVVSYFAPFTEFVRRGNEADPLEVGHGWLYARVDGQAFLHRMNHHMEDFFRQHGVEAISPYSSNDFQHVFAAGTNPALDPALSFTSNWSERHVAYVCGLGTFGLSKGLITKKGVAGRFGSFVISADLPTDERPYTGLYDYCSMCGRCAKNCPAHAISLEEGKKHLPCSVYVKSMGVKYSPFFGCGKCQVNTPCERGIANPKFR